MFAKRLTLIYLLHNGASFGDIEKLLYMSPSTIDIQKLKIEKGNYINLLKLLDKNKSDPISKIFNVILDLSSPKRMGSGRWRWLDEMK